MKRILILIIVLIIGCKSNQVKEIPPTINYIEDFKLGSQKIDTLKSGGVLKNYKFNLYINTQNDSTRIFEFDNAVIFNMLYVNEKNYFVPTNIINTGFSYFFYFNRLNEIIVMKDKNENIEFEIEFCLQFVQPKDMAKDKSSNQSVALKIQEAIQRLDDSKTLKKIDVSLDKNLILFKDYYSLFCRKFKFSKKEKSIIVQNINQRKDIIPKNLIKNGIIEITEFGDIMDTLNLAQKVWDKEGDVYLEK